MVLLPSVKVATWPLNATPSTAENGVAVTPNTATASLAALFPWELGVKADPFASAPAGIRPEWYFMFMFQTLKKIPAKVWFTDGEVVGILLYVL